MTKNRDVAGGGCVKSTDGRIVVEDDQLMKVWRKHYEKLVIDYWVVVVVDFTLQLHTAHPMTSL
jgi:hypothetical protein